MEIWTISDIHGHYDEFVKLLTKIGFLDEDGVMFYDLPENKKLVLLGDYVDRGRKPLEVLLLIEALRAHYGDAVIALMGNHDSWIYRHFKGNGIKLNPEREQTLKDIEDSNLYSDFTQYDIFSLYEDMPYHAMIEHEGQVYRFVHACYDHKASDKPKKKQSLMLYGPVVDHELDEKGFPKRIPWYEGYDGRHGKVIFGHYSMAETVSEFPHAVSVDCGVFKTGVLGAYEVISGKKEYVNVTT